MAANTDLTRAKYKDIREEYQSWCNKKYREVRIYTDDYIYLKLSEKFYLATATIEKIIFHRYSM